MKYTCGSRAFPLSRMKDFETSMKNNKLKIIEFSLRKIQPRIKLDIDLKKVKEIDYSKKFSLKKKIPIEKLKIPIEN